MIPKTLFEKEYGSELDLTPGNLLDTMYRDPTTEQAWRVWRRCWSRVGCHLASLVATPVPSQPAIMDRVRSLARGVRLPIPRP